MGGRHPNHGDEAVQRLQKLLILDVFINIVDIFTDWMKVLKKRRRLKNGKIITGLKAFKNRTRKKNEIAAAHVNQISTNEEKKRRLETLKNEKPQKKWSSADKERDLD
jgi:uncharacterized protein YaiL (DUF2058 family)